MGARSSCSAAGSSAVVKFGPAPHRLYLPLPGRGLETRLPKVFELVSIAVEVILAQYRQEVEKTVEHGVHCEMARNVAKIQAMKAEIEHTKNELAEERGRISSPMEEIGELKLAVDIYIDCSYQAEKGQRHAEQERNDMTGTLAQTLSVRSFAEDMLLVE